VKSGPAAAAAAARWSIHKDGAAHSQAHPNSDQANSCQHNRASTALANEAQHISCLPHRPWWDGFATVAAACTADADAAATSASTVAAAAVLVLPLLLLLLRLLSALLLRLPSAM
jgi:hypothetical protein